MTDASNSEARKVLLSDLPDKIKENPLLFEQIVAAKIEYYRKTYGEPHRIWVNPKDIPIELPSSIAGIKIEKRGGCVRGKFMIL